MASGTPKFPFLAEKTPPEGLWNPNFSFFGRKMPLLDQKMAENRCRNIDRTCHHHIRSIRSVPRGLILRRQRRREQNFGPDTLFWKVWSLRGGPTRSVPSNPSGPEPSRAVPSGPELPSAATCHGSPCWLVVSYLLSQLDTEDWSHVRMSCACYSVIAA